MSMCKRRIRPTNRATIHCGFLIQALRSDGAVHRCVNCGERMFVKFASGLCPLCYNGRRPLRVEGALQVVRDGLALAGVLDDPGIEVVPESGERAPSE